MEYAPTKICDSATVTNCLLSAGCKIEGEVERSILSPGVTVARGAVVRDSIIMDGTEIGADSVIDRSIIDKEVLVGPDCRVGYGSDLHINRENPKVLGSGLTIVGKRAVIPSGCKVGRNCIVYDNVAEDDFAGKTVPSGETVKPRHKPIRIKA
jgi:glucose-1-phosphate adenylyltransferase